MLKLFKKKEGEDEKEAAAAVEAEAGEPGVEEKQEGEEVKKLADVKAKKEEAPKDTGSGDSSAGEIIRLKTDMDKVKASIESFGEVRKGLTERINGLSEQIGELRAMIMDRDRTIQEIELKAVKAADLVDSVKPEKLMIQIQKEDAKFEALKANLEGNEAIMDRIMDELKEARKKLEFFRGIEEIIKLSEEVKKELVEIKKSEAGIQVNADKVNTIYAEVRKSFQDIEMFNDKLQESKVVTQQNSKDLDSLKTKVSGLADKNELEKLRKKIQRYIDALQEINKTSSLSKDVSQLKNILEGLK